MKKSLLFIFFCCMSFVAKQHTLETATYSTVTITNKETGEQVYSMIYAGTDHIQLDLKEETKGTYTLLLNIQGVKYTGEFTL